MDASDGLPTRQFLNFYLDLELGHTALQGIGECHLAKSDFPEPGLIALSCFLNLSDPLGRYVGGQLTANDDGWKSVKPWIKEKKVNYPIVIGNEGLGKQYGLVGMPLTALVDRDGRIADVHRGIVQKMATQEKIRDLLNASLKNPTN